MKESLVLKRSQPMPSLIDNSMASKFTRPVAIWLFIGVGMIMVQVLLGGVTRLTGSGLSITDWDPIIGAIPPLNHHDWMVAFHKYQHTPQYRIMNEGFTLQNFKYIFFWEWFHRLWARLLGVVFLAGFVIFLVKKRFVRGMAKYMIILFLLGALQGLVGWIMVESGFVGNRTSVSHFKLTAHFMTAMVLLCYTLWFALKCAIKDEGRAQSRGLHRFAVWIIVILGLQLIYGGFMAGLHAALAASTWPSINGMAIPAGMFTKDSFFMDITSDPITVQFIHRDLAYLLCILTIIWSIKARRVAKGGLLRQLYWLPIAVVLVQITLGVLTVLGSNIHIPIDLAVTHQFVGVVYLVTMFFMLFLVRGKVSLKPKAES